MLKENLQLQRQSIPHHHKSETGLGRFGNEILMLKLSTTAGKETEIKLG